jgi:hypothetical protein
LARFAVAYFVCSWFKLQFDFYRCGRLTLEVCWRFSAWNFEFWMWVGVATSFRFGYFSFFFTCGCGGFPHNNFYRYSSSCDLDSASVANRVWLWLVDIQLLDADLGVWAVLAFM